MGTAIPPQTKIAPTEPNLSDGAQAEAAAVGPGAEGKEKSKSAAKPKRKKPVAYNAKPLEKRAAAREKSALLNRDSKVQRNLALLQASIRALHDKNAVLNQALSQVEAAEKVQAHRVEVLEGALKPVTKFIRHLSDGGRQFLARHFSKSPGLCTRNFLANMPGDDLGVPSKFMAPFRAAASAFSAAKAALDEARVAESDAAQEFYAAKQAVADAIALVAAAEAEARVTARQARRLRWPA